MDFIRKQVGGAGEATTWVCTVVPGLKLPYHQEALKEAKEKNISLGLHLESESILVRFPEAWQNKDARSKIQTILVKGGAPRECINTVESFDLFHAESWGMLAMNMPDKHDLFDQIIEPDDSSEDEPQEAAQGVESEATLQVDGRAPGMFALAIPQGPRRIMVPSFSEALLMEPPAQTQLKAALAAAGPLAPDIEKRLFPRGMAHASQMQADVRLLARKTSPANVIRWWSDPPEFIHVYVKPNMAVDRRVDYMGWKAKALGLDLQDEEVFLGLFMQIYCGGNKASRMRAFQEARKLFDPVFQWMDLSADMRTKLNRMNDGKVDVYCKNCNSVLGRSNAEFCCNHCERQWCPCGVKYSTRMVQDIEKMGLEQEKLGNFGVLVGLAEMLLYKDELVGCRTIHDILAKFDEFEARRAADKCCAAVSSVVVCRKYEKCEKCIREYQRLSALQDVFMKIRSGKVNWGHCHVAADQLAKLRDINPMMVELFCETCAEQEATEPASKRMRIL